MERGLHQRPLVRTPMSLSAASHLPAPMLSGVTDFSSVLFGEEPGFAPAEVASSAAVSSGVASGRNSPAGMKKKKKKRVVQDFEVVGAEFEEKQRILEERASRAARLAASASLDGDDEGSVVASTVGGDEQPSQAARQASPQLHSLQYVPATTQPAAPSVMHAAPPAAAVTAFSRPTAVTHAPTAMRGTPAAIPSVIATPAAVPAVAVPTAAPSAAPGSSAAAAATAAATAAEKAAAAVRERELAAKNFPTSFNSAAQRSAARASQALDGSTDADTMVAPPAMSAARPSYLAGVPPAHLPVVDPFIAALASGEYDSPPASRSASPARLPAEMQPVVAASDAQPVPEDAADPAEPPISTPSPTSASTVHHPDPEVDTPGALTLEHIMAPLTYAPVEQSIAEAEEVAEQQHEALPQQATPDHDSALGEQTSTANSATSAVSQEELSPPAVREASPALVDSTPAAVAEVSSVAPAEPDSLPAALAEDYTASVASVSIPAVVIAAAISRPSTRPSSRVPSRVPSRAPSPARAAVESEADEASKPASLPRSNSAIPPRSDSFVRSAAAVAIPSVSSDPAEPSSGSKPSSRRGSTSSLPSSTSTVSDLPPRRGGVPAGSSPMQMPVSMPPRARVKSVALQTGSKEFDVTVHQLSSSPSPAYGSPNLRGTNGTPPHLQVPAKHNSLMLSSSPSSYKPLPSAAAERAAKRDALLGLAYVPDHFRDEDRAAADADGPPPSSHSLSMPMSIPAGRTGSRPFDAPSSSASAAAAAAAAPFSRASSSPLTEGTHIKMLIRPVPREPMAELMKRQENKCAGCAAEIYHGYLSKPRFCHYTGSLYCASCHHRDWRPIPGQVLLYGNTRVYKVCTMAVSFLDALYDLPTIPTSAISEQLRNSCKDLRTVLLLRQQLAHIRAFIFTCKKKEQLLDLLQGRLYMLSDTILADPLANTPQGATPVPLTPPAAEAPPSASAAFAESQPPPGRSSPAPSNSAAARPSSRSRAVVSSTSSAASAGASVDGSDVASLSPSGVGLLDLSLRDMWSLRDLVEVLQGVLAPRLSAIVKELTAHITLGSCEICASKAFFCGAQGCAHADAPIYAFQIRSVLQCPLCAHVCHRSCVERGAPCPKCARQAQRRSAQAQKLAAAKQALTQGGRSSGSVYIGSGSPAASSSYLSSAVATPPVSSGRLGFIDSSSSTASARGEPAAAVERTRSSGTRGASPVRKANERIAAKAAAAAAASRTPPVSS